MPIYEYQCNACNHLLETMQKMNDPVLTDCPACGASRLRKLISASAFRLTGDGWYETDFKTKKPSEDKSNSDPSETKSETKKTENSTDSATATATKKEPKASASSTPS